MGITSRNQKWIAGGLVVLLFFFIQLPASQKHPVAGETGLSAASADGAGAIERISGPAPAKKKSPLVPILIGVAAAGTIAVVLVLVLKKSRYDITGDWNLSWVFNGPAIVASMTCTGSRESGTVSYRESGAPGSGNYTVNGNDDVQITIHFGPIIDINLQGKFDDENHLSGSVIDSGSGTGTFTAARILPAG